MFVWRPRILAIGFKSKVLSYALRVVFFNAICLMLGQRYELVIVKYVSGHPPTSWLALLRKIRAGKVRLLPASVRVVAISEVGVPLEVTDPLTIVYLMPQEVDAEDLKGLRDFCLEQLVQDALAAADTL